MIESFFGLREEPFSIAPDPRFLYMSRKHSEALVLLNLGLTRGASFVLLTGEIGAGKTTVWRRFLEELPPNVDVASVVNPKLDVDALLRRVFEDLHVELPETAATIDLIDALHGHLLLVGAQGRRTLIAIDEAQALSMDVLEQLRLLTNLDASGKRLQIMLIAQPEMRQILERPELEPLAQRIVARYHLGALSAEEATLYIGHRMFVAGLSGPLPFDDQALAAVHHYCGGVPRRINVLCDRALALAASMGTRRIGREIIERAAVHAFGEALPPVPAPAPALSPPPEAPAAPASPPAPAAAAPWPKAAFVGVAGVALVAGAMLANHFGAAALPKAAPAAAAPAPAASTVALPATPSAAVAPVSSLESAFTPAAADEPMALRALASRWGQTLPVGDPCMTAVLQGLLCYRTRGSLAAIRQIGRPGLLRLVDGLGHVAHAQLLALRDEAAVLAVSGTEREVSYAELARWWRGEFVTFWRAPPGYREADSSADAAWLEQQLDRVAAGSAPAGGADGLRARIVAFQTAQGLVPDGVAGPLTLMQLNRASGVDEPHLGLTSDSRPS